MIKNKIGVLVGVIALALGLAACGSSSSSTTSSSSSSAASTISGAGSTFAAPVYEQWASSLSPLTVNYQAVGSGAGITSLESKTVDFGASDPPLKPEDFAALEKVGPPVQIPMFLGAITVSYNLPASRAASSSKARRSPTSTWARSRPGTTPKSRALNPGVNLPSTPITVIHRSDSSGTTAGFTGFLSVVDPEFKSKVGEGKDVQWPVGTGAKGNAGVAGAVQQTQGAVGYVEQAYALEHNFTYASVRNKAGNFVAPNLASTSAAASEVTVPAESRDQNQQPGRRERLPDHLADIHRRLQGHVQSGHPRRRRGSQGSREVPRLRARAGSVDPLAGGRCGAAAAILRSRKAAAARWNATARPSAADLKPTPWL